jgi:hypothetical protein
MSIKAKLSVVFQSRVGDGIECSPEKILLHSVDFKTLKVKIGASVQVEMPNNTFCLLCAWPSKKGVAGTVVLNKIWMSNFPSAQKQLKLLPIASNW